MQRVDRGLVPKDLNFLQKERRVEVAKEMLSNVSGDDSWVYEYDVETAQQSSEQRAKNEPKPEKPHQSRSKLKVMLVVFFDYRGVVHHEFVPECKTVNKEYYWTLLRRLREAIPRKQLDLQADNSWIFQHDNAPSHSSLIVTEFLAKHENSEIWLPVTFSCFENSNIRSEERAMSRLRPLKEIRSEGSKGHTGRNL